MRLDKEKVLSMVRETVRNINADDASKSSQMEDALILALDDLSSRMQAKSGLTSYDVSLSKGSTEFVVRGAAEDLQHVYAVQLISTDESRKCLLDWKDPDQFLSDQDTQYGYVQRQYQYPTKYTSISAEDGFYVLRLDVAADQAYSARVYYFPEVSPETVGYLSNASVVVNGTVAYFYNGTEVGDKMLTRFLAGVARARANNDVRARPEKKIEMETSQSEIRQGVGSIRRFRE